MVERDCIGYHCDSMYWNLPISDSNQINNPFADPKNTILIQNRVRVRGRDATSTIYNAYSPKVGDEISNYNITPNPRATFNDGTFKIIEESCKTDDDKTIYFKNNSLIIDGKVADIQSNTYNVSTPLDTPLRKKYCQCGESSYVEVNPNSGAGCLAWCCAFSPVGGWGNDIYGCAESNVTGREWLQKLGKDTITYGTMLNKPQGVVLGKDPKQPKQI